ncbi:MAG: fused MFS/spermidine synthase [Micrococcales bacterium]|nr:fused MFS/spermidine synthase [Micrococcales bacterium]
MAGGWEFPAGAVEIASGTVRCVRTPGDPNGVLVEVNGAPSSYLDLKDPLRLEFEYMAWMFAAITQHLPTDQALRAIHIGGAGCALPRALDAAYPKARQLVYEIDPVLARLAREWFDLPRAPRLRIRAAEGAQELRARRDGSCDVIVRDAFVDGHVPPHMLSVEFAACARRVLTDQGIYAANCAGTKTLDAAKSEVAAVAGAFPYVAVIAEPGQLRGRRWGNAVILGGGPALAGTAIGLVRRLTLLPFPARIIAGQEAVLWAGRARPIA